MSEGQTVLVTGGSGYIGGWTIVALLKQGYTVRTTIRNLARADEVRANIAKQVDPGNRLAFFAADLMSDAGWDEAAAGCDYVLHIASPLGGGGVDAESLIRPAREGALRALKAAHKAGVKRVVMTSSVAATTPPKAYTGADTDESVWTDLSEGVSGYYQSKTLAERAAWDFMATAGGPMTLATVNPAAVLGPVMSEDYSGSIQIVERLMTGRVPGLPRLGFNVVDVRDVADLHLLAMTAPEAAGQRFIAAGPFMWMGEIAELLRLRFPDKAAKIPTRKLPDFVLKIVALFDVDLKEVVPSLGKRKSVTSAKAISLLGWEPRPANDTIVDCANSLIAEGAI